ncbi:hypothetical protein [Amycolatopsis panacis]|uniref:hypothetical protein n=1 Tax=Amycolatopsis panacis TaxID=2340917 RepID=UPI0011C3AD0F|nr:hypothetical protein [Amycolatopsis panacis]
MATLPYSNTQEIVGGKIEVDNTPLVEKLKGNHWETAAIDWAWRNFFSDKGEGLYAALVNPVAGDFNRIAANAKAWKYTAESFDKIRTNITDNKDKLLSSGWASGAGAKAFDEQISLIWSPALSIASKSADYLAKGFDKLSEASVKAAEKVVDLLDKIVSLIAKLFTKFCPGVGQIAGLIDWIASGFHDFPYWSDIQNIGRLIDAIFTLHKKISALVNAAKGYVAGANQIVDAIKAIPEAGSFGDATKIAFETKKGVTQMQSKKKDMDKKAGEVHSQRERFSAILDGG